MANFARTYTVTDSAGVQTAKQAILWLDDDLDNLIADHNTKFGATITGVVDEDNMASDSAAKLCSQQSIKAYVDDVSGPKNAIINGDFNIWQRGTSFAAIATNAYSADRFKYQVVGAAVHTIYRATDLPTQAASGHKSNYSFQFDPTTADAAIAAGDYVILTHRIEGYNFAPFMGKTATLSFWVQAVKTGIYCVSFRNSVSDRSYVVEYTINAASTWEKKTITLTFSDSGGTWDYINGVGLIVGWALAAGSDSQGIANTWNSANDMATSNQVNGVDHIDNNFWLAQVQFELGSLATDFEYRQFGDELARCQRYYEKSYDYDVAPATSDEDGSIQLNDPVAAGNTSVRFATPKRAAATIVGYSTTGASGKYRDLTSAAEFDITASDVGFSGFHVDFASSGAADELKGFHYTADAEL